MSVLLNVVAGRKREVIGQIMASPGLRTSKGKVVRTTPGGQVVTDSGRFKNVADVTVARNVAERAGFTVGTPTEEE